MYSCFGSFFIFNPSSSSRINSYSWKTKFRGKLNQLLHKILALLFLVETLLLGMATALVFVFLRPISQFIYFQF